ncbi:MAG: enhanced serine sensitivity protein SseB C-terminal domain-containing protein [Rhizomicrobium sp.]|nr:enhanced serine sensitivity protein SseB C-terminal domain-containing protein [Rhizomicrobium sp.]
MAFKPANALEETLLRAASQDSARPEFYRRLLSSTLTVLGSFGETMSIETITNEQGNFHPIFTAPERMKDFMDVDMPHFGIAARTLFEATRGAQFVINPGSVGKILSADEIAWFLQAFPSTSIIVARPKVYPVKLVKALCVLFTSRMLIRAAHLVYVAREGVDQEAHPMIGLEADGDVPRLAQEIFAAAEAVLPGAPIEVVYIDPQGELDPLQKHMLSVPPFYQRMLQPH